MDKTLAFISKMLFQILWHPCSHTCIFHFYFIMCTMHSDGYFIFRQPCSHRSDLPTHQRVAFTVPSDEIGYRRRHDQEGPCWCLQPTGMNLTSRQYFSESGRSPPKGWGAVRCRGVGERERDFSMLDRLVCRCFNAWTINKPPVTRWQQLILWFVQMRKSIVFQFCHVPRGNWERVLSPFFLSF